MSEAYTVGVPWRRKATGDPPNLDYSMCDDWVCPVYRLVENERQFFVDAVVTRNLTRNGPPRASAKRRSTLRARSTCSTDGVNP